MDLSFLPLKIKGSIELLNIDHLYEVRLRDGFPVILNYNFDRFYLGGLGATKEKSKAIISNIDDIKDVIRNVTERSIYAHNEKIKQGFLTTKDGIRIGLSGECVLENDKVVTIKNYSSILLRIPHEIIGCSKYVLEKIIENGIVNNTLIISPPFYGKTTLLKDLARQLNERIDKSILIIDERGEFSSVSGENIDKISFSNKFYAFSYGLRSLSPSIVITDELFGESDFLCVKTASNSGVKIIASCHANGLGDLINKPYFDKTIFDRYVVLESSSIPGKIKGVYGRDFIRI